MGFMHPDTEQTLRAIEQAVAGMSPGHLAEGPPGKWTSEQILEHLDLAFAGTQTAMRRTLEKGRPPARPGWRQRVAKWLIVDLGWFPSGFQAPEFVVPRGGQATTVLADIRRHLAEMDGAIAAWERDQGPQARFKHPRLGPLTGRQWRTFHLVHTRHHMKQIARLRSLASSAVRGARS